MRSGRWQVGAVALLGMAVMAVWIGGCPTFSPPKRSDQEQVRKDSDRGFEELRKEEDSRKR